MKAVLFYLLWVVLVVVCAGLARFLEVPLLAVLGMAMTAGALVLWGIQHGRQKRARQAQTQTGLWISQRGSASGYHRTDKLTSDGVLAGFDHDDFAPGFRKTYEAQLPAEVAEGIFERLRSAAFQSLGGSYTDPRIIDGFTLKITWRLDGVEKAVWLANTDHELLSPLVAEVWSHAPASAGRVLPRFSQ